MEHLLLLSRDCSFAKKLKKNADNARTSNVAMFYTTSIKLFLGIQAADLQSVITSTS
jgi:hypothetical protein